MYIFKKSKAYTLSAKNTWLSNLLLSFLHLSHKRSTVLSSSITKWFCQDQQFSNDCDSSGPTFNLSLQAMAQLKALVSTCDKKVHFGHILVFNIKLWYFFHNKKSRALEIVVCVLLQVVLRVIRNFTLLCISIRGHFIYTFKLVVFPCLDLFYTQFRQPCVVAFLTFFLV